MREQIDILKQHMTEARMERMLSILDQRTKYISVVIEDIFQAHNISAVLRSCDCFGIQDVHIMQGKNKYQENNEISLGSSKWLNTELYNKDETHVKALYSKLRAQGYRIVATSPHAKSLSPQKLDISTPIALVMGAEAQGLSEDAILHADESVKIPMYGFTESFNISVATAIILHSLRDRIQNEDISWQLDESAKNEILLKWCMNSVKDSELILKRHLETKD